MIRTGKPLDWASIEKSFNTQGRISSSDDPNLKAYIQEVRDYNARAAEAVAVSNVMDPVMAARVLLFRGRLDDAQALLQKLSSSEDPRLESERLIQEARLHAFNGQWLSCRESCDRALDSEVSATSLLALFQIRAVSHFELGSFGAALEDLGRVDSLASVFPNAVTVFYARLLKIRIEVRDRGGEHGLSALNHLWNELLSGSEMTGDHAQSILRAEVDIRRQAGLPHLGHALASYLIAVAGGEDLYAALAVNDCYHALAPQTANPFLSLLREGEARFQRVAQISRELSLFDSLPASISTSVQCIHQWQQDSAGKGATCPAEVNQADIDALLGTRQIYLLSRECLVTLSPWKIERLSSFLRGHQLLAGLSRGPRTKTETFHSVWGSNKRYAPNLHDNLIHSIIHKLKKKHGIEIGIESGRVCTRNILIF